MVMKLGLMSKKETPMPGGPARFACCDRCASLVAAEAAAQRPASGIADPAADATIARRRLLKAAVFQPPADRAPGGLTHALDAHVPAARAAGPLGVHPRTGLGYLAPSEAVPRTASFPDVAELPRTVFGTIADVSPQVLVLDAGGREQRFTLTASATAWRGAQLEPAALRHGEQAVVRLTPGGRNVADRIWVDIGRVTGVILERSGNALVVDEGATRAPQVIAIEPRAAGRIQVRFPILEPGYLVDVIGVRRDGELVGMIPATSQPSYPVHRLPDPPLVSGRVPDTISGAATWHEPHDEPLGVLGVAYPALDPETGCAEDMVNGPRRAFARMPYLALGSVLRVRNDCTDAACLVPVTGCATIARLFNDRCVTCGTSPRGRVADLTIASFIALGGELDRGCFNATITIGE